MPLQTQNQNQKNKNSFLLPLLSSSVPCIILSFGFLFILLFVLFIHTTTTYTPPITATTTTCSSQSSSSSNSIPYQPLINIYVADLPRSLNYGLLSNYWSSSTSDSRLTNVSVAYANTSSSISKASLKFPPYPDNPLIKQHSAEYWLLGDLTTPPELRSTSFARRVHDLSDADVVFVPFFAALSAHMQLGVGDKMFKKKVSRNQDYARQKQVVDLIQRSEAWKRSGGRNHVFVLTSPVAMWHLRAEIAPAILLVVDFGGWYRLDSKASNGTSSSEIIQHTQVSLLKDVILPYTHLLPRLHISENQNRPILLYFRGAKHRYRGGLVREKLWDLLVNETGVAMEEGFPDATGAEQSMKGMRNSEFCLHPAGDTPASCRLFDAILSLCIPVIVSDKIELPFEGMVDYSEISVFVSVSKALEPGWLVGYLKNFSEEQKHTFRQNIARIQHIFEYDNGYPGGIGPISSDGAVNHIWRKVHQKLPMIREAIVREKRKPKGVSVPLRCHCT